MTKAIISKLKNTVLASLILLITLLFISPVEASEILTTIDELPQKEDIQVDASTEISKTENNDIVILYKTDDESNVSDLNLEKSNFAAGSKLNGQVDVLEVKDEGQVDTVINDIKQNDNVLAVSKDGYITIQEGPNDKFYAKYQADYLNLIGYGKTWNQAGKNQVKIAVLDTGINKNHEDLKGIVVPVKNYTDEEMADTEGHGTGVASVIGAITNNGLGLSGTVGNSNVKIYDYKIADKDGSSKLSSLAQAITDAANSDSGIKVLNISMGAYEAPEIELAALKLAEDKGLVVVAASGNSNDGKVMYPAKYPTVIATGAVNNAKKRCTPSDWGSNYGSNYGDGLNMVAPGNAIAVCSGSSAKEYTLNSGTSFSSPIVAGACALALSYNPDLTPAQVRNIIYSTAEDLGPNGYDTQYGYGLVRLDNVVKKAQEVNDDSITVENPTIDMAVGENAQINATSKEGASLDYSSSNNEVATVNSFGVVKAVGVGNCTITVSSTANSYVSATVEITVTDEAKAGSQKVYRLYNKVTGEHLFTTDENEVNSLAATPDWDNEGSKWESPENGTPVYRLYSVVTGNHLYTADDNEINSLVGTGSWTIDNGSKPLFYSGGNTNVYRLYNNELRMHLLTTDESEYNALTNYGWTQEGAKFSAV